MKFMPKWRKFWQFFYKAPIILKKPAKFSILGGIWSKNWPKMFKNWPKCPNLKRFCQRKWQDLAKFSIWGGIWSKNWPKCSNFKRFFQTEWPKPAKFSNWGGICSRNWQKFANFKRSFQREWPKPAKFSNWVGFGPNIGQNVQILSGFFSKRVTKTNKIFKLGGGFGPEIGLKMWKNCPQKIFKKKFSISALKKKSFYANRPLATFLILWENLSFSTKKSTLLSNRNSFFNFDGNFT